MKKLISIVLTLSLILSFSIPAFADTTNVTIEEKAVDASYEGYQLLDLTISLKEGEHHPATCDGTNHSDDCYNYAYTVNGKYRAILQEEVFNNAGTNFWGNEKPSTTEGVKDPQILEYLTSQTSDNGDKFGTLRPVADRIYRAILQKGIAADITGMSGVNDKVDKGYWLIADVTAQNGETAANSLVMLDTKGESAITVTPKTALPTLEKKVKDIEDSEDENISDNPWHDSADHDMGDTIPFKLTGTLPSNAQYYTSYKMVFHDEMSNGLTLDTSSFKVLMYDTKHKADVDTDLNDGQDVSRYFTKKFNDFGDSCTFEVSCDNVFEITGVTKDTAFVVYYEATLNENAVIGSSGNPNEAYLEFSNNPYGDGTGQTKKDKVVVYTYQLIVNKTDSHGHALEGAGFKLYKKTKTGDYNLIGSELTGVNLTTFEWKGLDDGDYKLEESTVPAGYNKMSDIVFSISASHSETADEPELISLEGGLMGTGEMESGKLTGKIIKDIENHTGTVLPETGAKGTMMLIMGGGLLVAFAAVFMITRKKMSIYEE